MVHGGQRLAELVRRAAGIRQRATGFRQRAAGFRQRAAGFREWLASRRRVHPWLATWRGAAVAAAVVAGAAIVVTQHNADVAERATRTMLSRPGLSAEPYARLRVGLRAYRSDANGRTEGEVDKLHDRYAGADHVLPDASASLVGPDGRRAWADPPGALLHKVSADGRTLATTDPRGNLTIWRLDGARVSVTALNRHADHVALGGDGRYVAYLENVQVITAGAAVPPHACLRRRAGTVFSECLFGYDRQSGQLRELSRVEPFALGHRTMVRVDPSGRVAAVVMAVGGSTERVSLWELATGRTLASVTVPARILSVTDAWLGPGSRTIVLAASTAEAGPEVGQLIAVDLAGPPTARVLAQQVGPGEQVAASMDGRRLAAVVPAAGLAPASADAVVWDVDTGREVARLTGLDPEDTADAGASLDATGERLFLTAGRPGPDGGRQVSAWPVAGGAVAAAPLVVDGSWRTVLPLGVGDDVPIALADGDVVALMLAVPGRPLPLARQVGARPGRPDTGRYVRDLCARLASDVEAATTVERLPPGAYRGELCR